MAASGQRVERCHPPILAGSCLSVGIGPVFWSTTAFDPLPPVASGSYRASKQPAASGLLRTAAFLQLLHYFIHVEAGCLLPLRIVLERHQELTYVGLGGNELECVIEQPIVVGV
jgi:hypothetical protein